MNLESEKTHSGTVAWMCYDMVQFLCFCVLHGLITTLDLALTLTHCNLMQYGQCLYWTNRHCRMYLKTYFVTACESLLLLLIRGVNHICV